MNNKPPACQRKCCRYMWPKGFFEGNNFINYNMKERILLKIIMNVD